MRVFMAFTGVKEAGKTTSFNILRDRFPFVQEITLAKHLKDVSAQVFKIERSWFDDQRFKEKELDTLVTLDGINTTQLFEGFKLQPNFDKHIRPHMGKVLISPRQIAQYVGTEVLRNYDNDVHCNYVTQSLPEKGFFVVTDMRFPNEFDYFFNRYPQTFAPFYIHNPNAEAQVGPNSHESERYVLEIGKKCQRIDNTGSMTELEERVIKEFQALLNRFPGAL